MLRTPVMAPLNMVSMINLESCVLQTPTYFSTTVLGSATNAFDVYNAAGAFQYSLWKNINDAAHTVQSNTQSMSTLLKKCVNIDMTNKNNLASFFCDFVTSMQLFKITFGNTSFPNQANTAPFFIQYGVPTNGNYVYGYTGSTGENSTGTTNVTVSNLATMLGLMNTITFTITLMSTTDTNSYRIAGPWIKMLMENPTLTDTSTTNQYVKFINNSFTLQVQGYDMINIHTTFAKSVLGASTAMDNLRLVPTDILWSLLITNGPNSKTYFSNMNSAGKVIYFMPIMEEIEIYFTDEWGDRIIDQLDFQMVLTFDFAAPEPFPEPPTTKRARREFNL